MSHPDPHNIIFYEEEVNKIKQDYQSEFRGLCAIAFAIIALAYAMIEVARAIYSHKK